MEGDKRSGRRATGTCTHSAASHFYTSPYVLLSHDYFLSLALAPGSGSPLMASSSLTITFRRFLHSTRCASRAASTAQPFPPESEQPATAAPGSEQADQLNALLNDVAGTAHNFGASAYFSSIVLNISSLCLNHVSTFFHRTPDSCHRQVP